jgi:hypothetical protein
MKRKPINEDLPFDEALPGRKIYRTETSEEFYSICARAKRGEFILEAFDVKPGGGYVVYTVVPQKHLPDDLF